MSVQIRFHFGSDKDNDFPYAGWYIDNVAIKYPYVQPVGVQLTKSVSPGQFWLAKNYPNPFNNSTTIVYTLPKASHVTIAIYNIVGQLAKVLINKDQEPGKYQIRWDGNDSYGHRVTSGVYFICMKYGDQLLTRKALVLR